MRKIITTFGLILITTFSFAQETKYVNTELLNVRSGAGANYDVVDKIAQGEKVTTYSTQGKWTEIELTNGKRGYVSTKFLSDSQNKSSSSNKKGNSWIGYIIVIGFILYGLNKVRKFFSGGSSSYSGSSSNSQPQERRSEKPQPKPKQKYICKHCGYENENLGTLTFFSCNKSPTKKHQPLEGGVQEMYSCKHCGYQNKNLGTLTFFTCHRSPTGKHQPLS
ncbi:SH3 domain-containing protein [Myroides sp. C8-3]|uniref:SH3 domain-containing protein n=1 Tax=Myroides sp. C8-3 TaxID=3400533 RepID=UPI003D2F6979